MLEDRPLKIHFPFAVKRNARVDQYASHMGSFKPFGQIFELGTLTYAPICNNYTHLSHHHAFLSLNTHSSMLQTAPFTKEFCPRRT